MAKKKNKKTTTKRRAEQRLTAMPTSRLWTLLPADATEAARVAVVVVCLGIAVASVALGNPWLAAASVHSAVAALG